MSNALYVPPLSGGIWQGFWAVLAQTTGPQTAPAATGPVAAPTGLLTLVGIGICVLAVWLVRCLARPSRVSLRRTPGRPNTVGILHVIAPLAAAQLTGWGCVALLQQAFGRGGGDEAGMRMEVGLLAGLISGVVWLGVGLAVAAGAFRHGLRRGMGLSARRWLFDGLRGVVGYLAVLPVCVGLFLLVVWISKAMGIAPTYHPILQALSHLSPGWKALAALSAVVVAPLAEEVYFRGLVQSAVRSFATGAWPGILVASVFFSLMHVGAEPQAVPSLFALSLAMGYTYERTGRLASPILIHALFNAVNLAFWQGN